jgi:hypothetical protein
MNTTTVLSCSWLLAASCAACCTLNSMLIASPIGAEHCLQDNSSYAYVSGELDGAMLNGVGIFIKPTAVVASPATTAAAAVGGVNYLLEVNNSTFLQALETYAAIDTHVPLFMQLATNISWGHQMPEAGEPLAINRQLALAGQGGVLTAIDFASRVNQVALTGQWSNITFDGLVLENLGIGDR